MPGLIRFSMHADHHLKSMLLWYAKDSGSKLGIRTWLLSWSPVLPVETPTIHLGSSSSTIAIAIACNDESVESLTAVSTTQFTATHVKSHG